MKQGIGDQLREEDVMESEGACQTYPLNSKDCQLKLAQEINRVRKERIW